MIEASLIYDLVKGVDQAAYQEWAKKAIALVLKSPGVVEYRAYRNLLGSPQVRSTTVFKTLADWANFAESDTWKAIEPELRKFATDFRMEIWGPSPIVPQPLRPAK